ncbi:MAG: hypothetical protein P4L53_26705 [Candidatus Obscuribacterales bacterium]|nr:hypothetical protein [Candidatus Obscuribacterales bacterium]
MKTATKKNEKYEVNVLTATQARELFDKNVQENLGIGAEKFITNYQDGLYEDRDDCDIMSLLLLLPFTGYSAEYGKKSHSHGK